MPTDVTSRSFARLGQSVCARQRGFTLVELIMVIVIMGVLAVYAVPKLFDSSLFYAKGFHDDSLAYLRYAQKTAIAQRRTICVSFGSSSVTLNIASAAATTDCAAAGTLSGPQGVAPATLTAKPGISYTVTPSNFNFNGLGQPITGAGAAMGTQSFQVTGAPQSITVEAVTGYVHE